MSLYIQNNISNKIYLKIIKQMKKIDHIAIKDILLKRQIKNVSRPISHSQDIEVSLLPSNRELLFDHVIERILKHDQKNITQCQLNLEQKYALIEFMSEKQNISYNRNTLVNLITVWRCPTVLYIDNSSPMDGPFGKRPLRDFFLIQGLVQIFQNKLAREDEKMVQNQQQNGYLMFETESKMKTIGELLEGKPPQKVMEQFSGYGPLFNKKQEQQLQVVLKINNAIIIQVKPPEFQSMLVNNGGMDQEQKLKIIQQFPVFTNISRRIFSILPHIELKKYSKNDNIYKMKQAPQAIYLILKGQIIFEVKIQIPKGRKNTSNTNTNRGYPSELQLQTQSLGVGNYFGEEQIVFKQARTVNAICNSAECDILEIPVEKVQKLLSHSDFYEELKRAAQVKIAKRKEKISKALQIFIEFNKASECSLSPTNPKDEKKFNGIYYEQKKSSLRKRTSVQPIKVMHGNVIKKIPIISQDPVNFSMLGANPDMYQATLKKFRKYTMKQPEKYKPDVNWNLKRVWKVLNLQSILREDVEISSPQGRKFYQSHRRFQNHVNQVKSLRPKTSSSTYRTKLQYIAYLQQFNN